MYLSNCLAVLALSTASLAVAQFLPGLPRPPLRLPINPADIPAPPLPWQAFSLSSLPRSFSRNMPNGWVPLHRRDSDEASEESENDETSQHLDQITPPSRAGQLVGSAWSSDAPAGHLSLVDATANHRMVRRHNGERHNAGMQESALPTPMSASAGLPPSMITSERHRSGPPKRSDIPTNSAREWPPTRLFTPTATPTQAQKPIIARRRNNAGHSKPTPFPAMRASTTWPMPQGKVVTAAKRHEGVDHTKEAQVKLMSTAISQDKSKLAKRDTATEHGSEKRSFIIKKVPTVAISR